MFIRLLCHCERSEAIQMSVLAVWGTGVRADMIAASLRSS
jgi:hypothetical protein